MTNTTSINSPNHKSRTSPGSTMESGLCFLQNQGNPVKLLRNNLKRNMTINSVIYASEHQDGNDNSKRNMMSFEDHEGNYSSQQTGVAVFLFSYNSKGNKTILRETKDSVPQMFSYNSKGNKNLQQTGVADYKGDRDIIDEAVADVANRKTAEPWAILVATKTCPNCAAAKKMLDKAGYTYKVVYADDDTGAAIARENGIVQAPTLLVPAEDGYKKFTNVGEISKFTKASVTA